ncbi:MAG: DUF4920 domain-containing protein [Ignavibacteriae bacterium]|nr:MAG: DUF4920 domain-containing protein [Ignavibacteriota bacterium]
MKNILSIISAFLLLSFITVSFAQDNKDEKKDEKKDEVIEVKGKQMDDGVLYGDDFSSGDIAEVTITDLLAKPDDYSGKVVKITGDITDVCQSAGCWMMLTDGTNSMRISTMHKFFFPKDAKGKVTAAGTFKVIEETEEHAKHMNEESKNPTMKTEDIKGPQKTFVLQTTGAKILK